MYFYLIDAEEEAAEAGPEDPVADEPIIAKVVVINKTINARC